MRHSHVILDCYTDEPSGYGVPPYVGTHVLHLSQALAHLGISHAYLTIDDLRIALNGEPLNTLRTTNKTKNAENTELVLNSAKTIYIIMGCFVNYSYFSAEPPQSEEIYHLLKNNKAEKL